MPVDFVTRPPYNVVQPGGYAAVNATEATNPSGLVGQPIPFIVGTAFGGKPFEPLYFQNVGQLQTALRQGPAYDGARLALGTECPQVGVVRIGAHTSVTQGSLTLKANSAGNVAVLTSLDYGEWVNGITVEVTAGPIVTLKYTDELGNQYKEQWNFTSFEGGTPTNAHVAEAINGKLYGFSGSNFVSAVSESGTGGLKLATAAALAGGGNGLVPLAEDWAKGLEALEQVVCDIVVPMTQEETIHAKVLEHCKIMSTPNARKRRRMVVGGNTGETVAQQIGRIENLRSARAELVYPGMYEFNAKGEQTLYAPFYRAAMIAGMWCGLPDEATSLTHKRTPEIGVETILSTVQGGPVDQLLLAGVTPFTPAPGTGVWCVDSLSGNNESNGIFRDFHKGRSADYVARFLELNLEEKFVGGKSLQGTRSSIQEQAVILCGRLLSASIIRAFKEPSVEEGPNTPPYVTSGNAYNVTAPVMLVDTTKFVFITVALQSPTTVSTSGEGR